MMAASMMVMAGCGSSSGSSSGSQTAQAAETTAAETTASETTAASAAGAETTAAGQENESDEAEADASEAETAADETQEEGADIGAMVGMANPMFRCNIIEDINNALGCCMRKPTACQPEDEKFFTIDAYPVIGEYTFTADGTEYILRAARTRHDISGVYTSDSTLGALIDMMYAPGEDGMLQTDEGFGARWFAGDFQYSLYAGTKDGAAFEAMLDDIKKQVNEASETDSYELALKEAGHKMVKPLPENVFADGQLIDSTLPAELDLISIDEIEGTHTIMVCVYTEDLYDAVDINALEEGDVIIYNGDMIKVSSISTEDSFIYINGGLENGGCCLASNEGGTYIAAEFDDYCTYTCQGTVGLSISDDCVFNDAADISEPEKYMGLKGDALYERLSVDDVYGFSQYNTKIHVENGSIVEIERRFTP